MGNSFCGFRDSKTEQMDYECPAAPRLQRRYLHPCDTSKAHSVWSLAHSEKFISTDTINSLSEPVHPIYWLRDSLAIFNLQTQIGSSTHFHIDC